MRSTPALAPVQNIRFRLGMLLMLANKQLDSEKLLSGVELNYVKRVANVGGDLVGLGTFRRPTTLHLANSTDL